MADIPAMTLASTTVDAAEIYTAGLFAPANPAASLEVLNGDVQAANYGGGEGTIPTWACRYGAFAVGFYAGFDRWEYVYARQMSRDAELRVTVAGLAAKFFLPWDAGLVLYGFQAWFRLDATKWDTDGTSGGPYTEHWDWRVKFDGSNIGGLYGHLPEGRTTIDDPALPLSNDPGIHDENRWRYVARTGSAKNVLKGYRTLDISVNASVFATDQKTSKLTTPTGACWCLCLR